MKKFILSIAAFACVSLASAQVVGGYKATTKQDIALEGATVVNSNIEPNNLQNKVILSDAVGGNWDTVEGKGFPIGFEFPFNGQKFTYFGISSQGLIKLSTTEDMKIEHSNYFVTQQNDMFNNLIYCYDKNATSYAADNTEGYKPTTISYKTTGDELVVEWKDLGLNTSSWGEKLIGTYTMQIHLLKDGRIKYRFAGLSDVPADEAGQVILGVRGGINEYVTFKDLSAKESEYAQSNSFQLSPVTDGYTITLNTPDPTVKPTAQPTNLNVATKYNQGSVSATATFDKAEGVDNYLMVISQGAPAALPEDGKFYESGDSIGNAKVILAGQPGSWGTSAYDLAHASEYTITVYGYNSFGTEGPKYNTVEPLQASFATAPSAPAELKAVASSQTSLKLTATPNSKGNKVYVVYNTKSYNPENYGNRPYVGAPDASLKVGDNLTYDGIETKWNSETYQQDTIYIHDTEAGKVAYFGEGGEFEVSALDPSTSYYFAAYSYDEQSGTFSQGDDFVQAWTSTNIAVPFELNLSAAPENEIPGGWVSTPGGYNEGFFVDKELDYSKVKSQTEGNYIFTCTNQMDNSITYKLASPTIELTTDNKVSVDWHVHIMAGGGWFKKASLYDEWGDDDALEFVVYVDGQRVVLKKYDSTNAPVNENVYDEDETYSTALDWHSEQFDLAAYAGKNVQFGVEWLGANASTLYLGIENIKVIGAAATAVNGISTTTTEGRYYNLNGQQVNASSRGVLVKDNKKFVNK